MAFPFFSRLRKGEFPGLLSMLLQDFESVVGPMQNVSAAFLSSDHLRGPTSLVTGILLAFWHHYHYEEASGLTSSTLLQFRQILKEF